MYTENIPVSSRLGQALLCALNRRRYRRTTRKHVQSSTKKTAASQAPHSLQLEDSSHATVSSAAVDSDTTAKRATASTQTQCCRILYKSGCSYIRSPLIISVNNSVVFPYTSVNRAVYLSVDVRICVLNSTLKQNLQVKYYLPV